MTAFRNLLSIVLAALLLAVPVRGAVCDADLDDSDDIGFGDLLIVLSSWGDCPPPPAECPADLDGSGEVGFTDLLEVLAAWGTSCALPEIVITPVAHQGDPAPGIPLPGTFLGSILTPQIDAAGNVLLMVFLGGPEIDESNNIAVFYGPPGDLEKIVWESDPAPDMRGAIVISSLLGTVPKVSENGWITFSAELSGAGIIEDVNDWALFAGPPGDIRKVLQGGDQAPGLDPGITINVGNPNPGLGASISDHGTLWVRADIAGPGVDGGNDRVFWTGPRDDLQVVWREGMPAPGTEPGVTFAWADLVVFNDAGEILFRGSLQGPGIDDSNDTGRWGGASGDLRLITRQGDPVPGFPDGVTFKTASGGLTATNNNGDTNELALLEGPGITPDTDLVLFAGQPDALQVIAREGDPAAEAGPDVEIDNLGNSFLNDKREILYLVRYLGLSIDDTNRWAVYLGPYAAPQAALRDGDPAPQFPPEVVLARVGALPSLSAMNDTGDVVGVTEITGPGVTPADKVVLWRHERVTREWIPLLRGGTRIDDRIVSIPTTGDLAAAFYQATGGGDGRPQGLNDAGTLLLKLDFTDDTHGIVLLDLAPPEP
jgi:hypothetical protein